MVSRFVLPLALLACLCSCSPSKPAKPAKHPVVTMAPFDLDCPEEKLKYEHLNKKAWGVSGCGKRTKYIHVCRQVSYGLVGAFHTNKCFWERN